MLGRTCGCQLEAADADHVGPQWLDVGPGRACAGGGAGRGRAAVAADEAGQRAARATQEERRVSRGRQRCCGRPSAGDEKQQEERGSWLRPVLL